MSNKRLRYIKKHIMSCNTTSKSSKTRIKMKIVFLLLTAWFCLVTAKPHHHHRETTSSDTDTRTIQFGSPIKGQLTKSDGTTQSRERVKVVDSNLGLCEQRKIKRIIRKLYDSSNDKTQIAGQFQDKLRNMYNYWPHVVINYDAVAYFQSYYIFLNIDGDEVLAWGT